MLDFYLTFPPKFTIEKKIFPFRLNTNISYEKDLVILLSQSNEFAFERLYHLYSERLLGYLFKLVKSEAFAAEILQETFIKIWNNRVNIDPSQSFRSYLFRIAENLVYDFFRKAARDEKMRQVLMNSVNEYRHIEENLSVKENSQLLQEAINTLPAKRRQVFQMVKIEERSYEEVSGLLEVSTSTINDHIVKATKTIREKLQRYHISASIFAFLCCYYFL